MMKIFGLICCLMAFAMADVSHLSKTYLPPKGSSTTKQSDEPSEQVLTPNWEEIKPVELNQATNVEAFLQAQPKQAQAVTETQISTTYFPCPPGLYPCSQTSGLSGGILPGQFQGQGQFLGQGQYSGQGQFPGQGQFLNQGQYPGQGQFLGQGVFPGQGQFQAQGPFLGSGAFPTQGVYQGQGIFPGSATNYPQYGQYGPSNVNSLGPQVFPVQPGQVGGISAGANFGGRPSLFPGQNLLEAGANFLFGQNQLQNSNFYPRPSFVNSPYSTRPGFFTDNGESGEIGVEEELDAETFSPLSRSASDTKYDVNGGYVYDKPKFIVTL